jgi:hypothetical protein
LDRGQAIPKNQNEPLSKSRRRLSHVRFVPQAGVAPTEFELTRSVISPLSLYRAFAVSTRATWPIEHDGAGGAELLFVLDKALGYATGIRDSVLAKPHRIRRTCICILLRIGDCGERSHDRDYESNSAQFTHSVSLQFGLEGTMVGMRKCSLPERAQKLFKVRKRVTDMATITRDVRFTPQRTCVGWVLCGQDGSMDRWLRSQPRARTKSAGNDDVARRVLIAHGLIQPSRKLGIYLFAAKLTGPGQP